MQTEQTIHEVLNHVRMNVLGKECYAVVKKKGDGFLLQVRMYNIRDTKTGHLTDQRGGKYYISSHAVDSEVVMTAWKAFQDFIIHEAREGFMYKEQAIFGPHMNVNWLAEAVSMIPEAVRDKHEEETAF